MARPPVVQFAYAALLPMQETLPRCVRFGSFSLDLKVGELRAGNSAVLLQEQPLHVLRILIENEGTLVSREDIRKRLWPNDTIVEFEHSINAAINKLRKALADPVAEPQYIQTVARRGYRLMVPVEWDTPVGDESSTGEVSSSDDGTAVRTRAEPGALTGRTVSHYRVLGIIGGGGMGVVYRAEDLKLGRRVALKFLPEELGSDSPALQRFEREARIASSLNHHNICAIYEFGEHEGLPFLVMESLEGETLRDCLPTASEQGLPLTKLLGLCIQVTDGLQAAHENGIIHRDIKPANIFLTTKGVCKILDFGLAKLLEAGGPEKAAAEAADAAQPMNDTFNDPIAEAHAGGAVGDIDGFPAGTSKSHEGSVVSQLTRTGLAMGTAGYMSPEQVNGEKLDARTDLFSFGLVLYEMATGQRAFSGKTAAAVHDAILNQAAPPVRDIDSTLPPGLETIITKLLERDRDLRYQSASELQSDLQRLKQDVESGRRSAASLAMESALQAPAAQGREFWKFAVSGLLLAVLAGGLYYRSRQTKPLTDKDTIVLSDFTNTTGDSVFDDTLKQGLSVQLEQSPFLDLVSERRANDTLKLMGHSTTDRLTPEVTREVCQRTGSKAMLTGSISALGSQYVIGLKAVNCNTGDVLAEAQQQAAGKEEVLKALDAAAVSLRSRLGESLSSVQQYATPLEEATTPSLQALKAYSLGRKTWSAKGETAALPSFKRALELDPNFARAYVTMSVVYSDLNEAGRAAENARRAYELREKVSERERFTIEGMYYLNVTGDLEKAAQTYELWQQTYPRDAIPYGGLASVSNSLGNLEKALEEDRQKMRLEPNDGVNYVSLGSDYVRMNRLEEAEALYKQAEERKIESEFLLGNRYQLAFLKGDTAQMTQLARTGMEKPGAAALLLAYQADTEAWYGKLKEARELTRRAMDSARHNDAQEAAAVYQALAALREVESGNRHQALADADSAMKLAPNRDVLVMAGLALARAGNTAAAGKLAVELDRTFPLDTLVQRYWLPTIRAAVALERKDPNQAVELLKVTSAMELAGPALIPVYLRGEAYLMLHDGGAAAAEFQKFIDHRGLVVNFPWGALARLGLARAYAMQGGTTKAKTDYQDFLTLWKDADPDVPILIQAKAEYVNLQ